MTILLARIVPRDQLVAVHAPLGKIEWPGTIDHILATLPEGVPLILAPVSSGKTLLDRVEDPLGTVQDIVGGTGGQLAAALAVGAALVGSVLRFNAMQLMGAVGVGIAAGAGTGIVTGLVGTAIV